ncbi:hypothetical protein AVEN_218291-1 [Araneus ventricosus]|uniref:Uncharacterized protein n=1 Tax=Araneus ventricosus TaxID=182803 RepID=A0A4Y2SW09_ARAVE|nr:hypothetical protein AVEN_218291-1 [Araneus ventricosus]
MKAAYSRKKLTVAASLSFVKKKLNIKYKAPNLKRNVLYFLLGHFQFAFSKASPPLAFPTFKGIRLFPQTNYPRKYTPSPLLKVEKALASSIPPPNTLCPTIGISNI